MPKQSEHDKELVGKYKVEQFPRAAEYDMNWVHKNEMGPNVLWMTEALTQVMTLKPGMRVLDLGCGTAMSSIFLAREFGCQVWAMDLWVKPTENYQRIKEAGLEDRVFPIYAEAHTLPFANDFFDAVVSMDSYHYFGTDVHYLEFHLLKLIKPGGQIGIVSPASPKELPRPLPDHLEPEWYWFNSVDWWRHNWERNPELELKSAELLPGGWELWVRWHEFLELYGSRNRPDEATELKMLMADQGKYLGFVRMVAKRKPQL